MQLQASLGCYQCWLVGVVAASACARVRRGRGPHARAFSFLRIDIFCDRYARVSRCAFVPAKSGILPRLCRSLTPLRRIVQRGSDFVRRLRAFVRTGSDRFGIHARDRDSKRHSLTGLPGPYSGRFIRQRKGY